MPCPQCGAVYKDDVAGGPDAERVCRACWRLRNAEWDRYETRLAQWKARGSPRALIPWGVVWWVLLLIASVTTVFLVPVIGLLWFFLGRDPRPKPPSFGNSSDHSWVDYEPR